MIYDVTIDGKDYRLELDRVGEQWNCKLDGREIQIDAALARRDVISLLIGGQAFEIKREITDLDMHLWVGSTRYAADLRDPRSYRNRRASARDDQGPKKLVAPMPGKVVRILVGPGEEVEAGHGVVIVEAMKMQNEIKSPKKGRIGRLEVTEGAAVNAGDVLAVVE